MNPSHEATRVCNPGKPLSPHQTKSNVECFGGDAVASATPTSRGPAGVVAIIGPPLSPSQTVRWITFWRIFPLTFRMACRPGLPPASHSSEVGTGQKPCTNTVAVISRPTFGLRFGAGFLAPKPATESAVPALVSTESSAALAG